MITINATAWMDLKGIVPSEKRQSQHTVQSHSHNTLEMLCRDRGQTSNWGWEGGLYGVTQGGFVTMEQFYILINVGVTRSYM